MKKFIRVLLILLCCCFTVLFAYSSYRLYNIVREYKFAEKKYTQLSSQYVSSPSDPSSPAEASASGEQSTAALAERSPIAVNFSLLQEQNSDVVAWLYSPGTPINYPIVHGSDNDHYLNYFIDGSYTGSGTPFIDFLCAGDFTNQNTVIYGHHMQDGSMFASLSKYRNASYYEEHPYMYLNTPTQNYKIEIFAGYLTEADSDSYFFDFSEESDYLAFLQRMQANSNFPSSVELGPDDRIVTLSTCSYEYFDARYVVQGKLVPIR